MALKLGELQVDIGADTSGLKKADTEVKRTAKGMSTAFKKVGGAIAAAISIEAGRRILLVADSMRVLERRLVRFTGSVESAEKTLAKLVKTASETGSTIANTVSIFEKFSLVRDSIGATNDDIIQMTDTLQKLGALGGSTGTAISNSLTQMSQAFALGKFEAQEFKSVLENTPEIIKAVATQMGLTMGEIRLRMLAGKLTAQDVFQAMKDAAETTNTEFEAMPKSVSMVAQAIQNELAVAIGNVDDGLGFSAAISNAMQSFADLLAGINEASAAQEELNKLLAGDADATGPKGNPGARRRAARTGAGETPEVTAAQEINKLITRRDELERSIEQRVRGGAARAQERKDELRAELELVEKRITALKTESSEARRVAEIRAGIAAPDAAADTPEGATTSVVTLSAADAGRLKRLQELGESERQEIERQAVERLDFLKTQTQLQGDEILELSLRIEHERIGALRELKDQEDEENARRQQDAIDKEKQILSERLALLNTASNAISNLLQASGNDQAARAAAVIQGVATMATTIAAISAAQAQAQAAADPTAITVPQKIANIAVMASQFAGIFAALRGAKSGGGRQFGGSVSPMMAHPVNEGGSPELLTQGSKQFLLPNGKGGTVTPLKGGGPSGDGGVNITLISNGTPQVVEGTQITRGEVTVMINDASKRTEGKINASLATGRGDTARSLSAGFQTQRRLGSG